MGRKTLMAENDESLNRLLKKKEQIKSQIKGFSNFVRKAVNEGHFEELSVRLDNVEPLYKQFIDIIIDIEVLDPTKINSEREREEFEEWYYMLVAKARHLIASVTSNEPVQQSSEPSIRNAGICNGAFGGAKLPSLRLPKFKGEYDKWTQFYETFETLVHNNPQLDEIQKFYYLLDSLEEEARRVLDCLEVTRSNYSVALDLLIQRFYNKPVIIQTHLKALFDSPVVHKEVHYLLRSLADLISKHVRALNALGEPVESWDRLIIFFMSRKLDLESKKQWEEKTISTFQGDPKLADFLEFLTSKCRVLESVDSNNKPSRLPSNKPLNRNNYSHAAMERNNNVKCEVCKGAHMVYFCEKLLALSIADRIEHVRKLRLCMNCLRSSHFVRECKTDGCRKCHQRHHTLLHIGRDESEKGGNKQDSEASELVNTCIDSVSLGVSDQSDSPVVATYCRDSKENRQIILSTAVIQIKDVNGQFIECRALLDSGSQINFIAQELASKLRLRVERVNVPVTGVGQKVTRILHRANTVIKSCHNNFMVDIPFLVIDNVTANIPIKTFNIENLDIPKNLKLADPKFNQSSKVDALIGAGLFFDLFCAGQIKLGRNKPTLQKSVLGWIVAGPLVETNPVRNEISSLCHFVVQDDVQMQLEKFWALEECSSKKHYSVEEKECEEMFLNTVVRDSTGRFSVALPVKPSVNDLGDSLENAKKRFYSLESKFKRNLQFKIKYCSFMEEYLKLGHMTEIDKDQIESQNNVYYLPHHGVVNESSLTTKLRVVFDASAKTSTQLSLNNVLKVGPTVQDELFEVLVRFRQGNVVITADIEKMYRQVHVLPNYRDLQRIVWRFDPNSELKHYRLNTLTYGTAPASFLATRALKQVSLDIKEKLPDISRIIDRNFYVDDLIVTVSTVDEAVDIAKKLIDELDNYGFPLRKWASNKTEVMQQLLQNQCEDQGYFITDNDTRKTLGLFWRAKSDILEFIVRKSQSEFNNSGVTKRFILSVTSQIFDPLGLVGPVTVRAKVILQKLWKLNLQWDEAVPLDLFTLWNSTYSQLELLNEIQIPRQCTIENAIYFEIHGFSDASEMSYGACIYLKSVNENGDSLVRLVCAKSRVAPLKSISIPRLELCGAVLLARLVSKVVSALDINISKIFLWTDSMVTLSWLSEEPSTWKIFIANRVAEIQDLCKTAQWKHVRSNENPADIISRGVTPNQLKNLELWWQGPEWLQGSSEWWPQTSIKNLDSIPEKRKEKMSFIAIPDFSIFNRFSCLYKLKRVVALCFRFYNNLKRKASERIIGELSICELNECFNRLIEIAQQQEFHSEIHCLKKKSMISNKSKLKSLDPFIDNDILRVGGRLRYSPEQYSVKYPILLPKGHPLTRLIILEEHLKQLHVGPQALLAKLRQQFWIINGRREIRSVLSRCITCIRSNPTTLVQKMGNLPRERVTYQRPFFVCGVDYAGPFNVKDGKLRNRAVVKGYMCIFICFVTKAVHIELVGDMSTQSFLNCLKRFVSRRGLCSKIFSDNGTNFVGANNEFKTLCETLAKLEKDDEIVNYCTQQNIEWQYIPPRSPHQGGLWESSVKSAKRIVSRVVGNSNLTFEQLSTVFCQVEAVLNSRPLTPLSSHPNDLQALTPGHFLIGDPLNAIPQGDVANVPVNRLDKYHMLQQMLQHIWSRWSLEYLTTLQNRTKWNDAQSNIKNGAMVVLKEENTPPLMWKLGRVIDVHPGNDGIVRVVSVRTSQGVFKRAVQKVCLLPITDECNQ